MTIIAYLILGLVTGAFSGLIGIGGGIIAVPALVMLFGFTQQQAQGTTLAMLLPPVGILAAYAYYNQGLVDIKVAMLLAIGFILGGYFGAKFAIYLPAHILKKFFAIVLLAIGARMLLMK